MSSVPYLKVIPIGSIKPNTFNPNRMSERKFAEYVAEVRHLGRLPKPLVVRPKGNGQFEIIDGEHGWRAAKEVGFSEIPCEVREVDDFGSMRECYKRNRGGKDNPVLLGRMFWKMLRSKQTGKKLSIRELAKMITVPASTIGIYLDYVKAADLRSECAPETADDEIARLKQNQVRIYVSLPGSIRDIWLNAGADPGVIQKIGDWPRDRVAAEIHRFKLSKHLDPKPANFDDSYQRAARLCLWLDQNKHFKDGRAYVDIVAELALTSEVLDQLPMQANGNYAEALISDDAWRKLLLKAQQHSGKRSGLLAGVEVGVKLALQDAGVDPDSVCDPVDVESHRIVAAAPSFIESADHLRLEEKRWLAEIPTGDDEELIRAAQQMTCELLGQGRGRKRKGRKVSLGPDSVEDVFAKCHRQVLQKRKTAADEKIFSNPDELVQVIVERLCNTKAIKDGLVDGREAEEVLKERLGALDWPEFYLLASYVLNEPPLEDATRRWFQAVWDNDVPGVER